MFTDLNDSKDRSKYSRNIYISFGMGEFIYNLINTAFFAQVQYYYENEILLDIWLYVLAFLLYTIWNMFNDPIMGYLSDRINRFTKRWGKRFPWILIFVFPYCIIPIFIFSSPTLLQIGQLGVFLWLLMTIFFLDTFISIWLVNYNALFPDKFRKDSERKKVASITGILIALGIFLAYLIPPIIAKYGDLLSYTRMAAIISIIGIIAAFLMIPGIYENREMREFRYQLDVKEKASFIKAMKIAFKQKNFIAYVLIYLVIQTCSALITASNAYWVAWILGLPKKYEALPLIVTFITNVVSIPLWYKLAKKYGSKKAFVFGFLFLGFAVIPVLFISDLIGTLIIFGLAGIGMGSSWLLSIILSDVIDESVVISGKRQEGIYYGIRTFFARMSIAIQVILFAIVHTFTNYKPGDPSKITQTPLALFGIRILIGIIPLCLLFIGLFIFWKTYDITPKKAEIIKSKLQELNL